MVKHIVLWKLRDDDQKQQNMDHMIDILTSLVGKIEGLVSMEMGYNFNESNDFDVVLYATFKNAAALKYYQNHPEHLKCKEFVHSVVTARTAADYFFEEGVKVAKPFEEVPDAPEVQSEPDLKAALAAAMKGAESAPLSLNIPEPPVAPAPIEKTAAPVTSTPTEKPFAAPEAKKPAPVQPSVTPPAVGQPKPETKKPKFNTAPAPQPTPVSVPTPPPPTAPAAPVEQIKETTDIFGKKKLQVEVTPLDQRSDTWTCPNCGKIMPNYVGTCGCGEPKPFSFDEVPPALQPDTSLKPSASAYPTQKTTTAATPAAAPKSAPVEQIKETTDIFGKKKLQVEVTPLDQRSDTWTCPNCGKIMPNYVGTCGCGEPKPFSFDEVPPALQPDTSVKPSASAYPTQKTTAAATPAAAPKSAPVEQIKETTDIFGKKKLQVEVTPLDQRSDTWTCPNCGKIMPNYVGTCGCGEPKPFSFDEVPPALQPDTSVKPSASAYPTQKTTTAATPAAAPKSAPVEQIKETTDIFGKKKLQVEVTPLDQRSDTWTCPNCGKIMPNYVGTCGCGEPKPFSFDEVPPALQPDTSVKPSASAYPTQKTTTAATPAAAPKSAPVEQIKETTDIFGKKKLQVEVTPLDQRSDTWTCPNCGKIMPNYVGTCGCGEPKPFNFDEVPPALQPDTSVKPSASAYPTHKTTTAATPAAAPKSAPVEQIKETTDIFGKKKLQVEVTPLDQRSDTWTCPNCGKIMPNYVGTCGCGEPKPFSFDEVPPALQPDTSVKPSASAYPTQKTTTAATPAAAQPFKRSARTSRMPEISNAPVEDEVISDTTDFNNASPSIESYSPQTTPGNAAPDPALNFIRNDGEQMRHSAKPFGKSHAAPEPPAPMRYEDTSTDNDDDGYVSSFNFDDVPEAAPMRFDDAPPERLMKGNTPPPPPPAPKHEKKPLFGGRKAKEAEALRQAQEMINNRKDIPDGGTWTCPNCGKVMSSYVGTCGCGEPKPFEF